MPDCPCLAQGERQCLGPPTHAEHRNFMERLKTAAHKVKQAARNIGDPTVEATEALLTEIRVAQGVVRRVAFLQHRATAAQASQYRAGLAKLEREVGKAIYHLPQ